MLDHTYAIILAVCAGISVTASVSVILTLLLFKEMRTKPFMRIIAYISLSDLLGNISYIPARQAPNGSVWCTIESFLNLSVYPSSWLWTVVLVYCLYKLALTKSIPTAFIQFHAMCWGVPLTFVLCSIPFSSFHNPREGLEYEVCTVSGDVASTYHVVTYYGMLFSSVITMYLLLREITKLEHNKDPRINEPSYVVAKAALTLYPNALLVCWLPHVVTVAFLPYYSNNTVFRAFYVIGDALKILHGLVTAIVFFSKSQEARRLWHRFLYSSEIRNNTSFEIRTMSEEVITENCLIQELRLQYGQNLNRTDTDISLSTSRDSDA